MQSKFIYCKITLHVSGAVHTHHHMVGWVTLWASIVAPISVCWVTLYCLQGCCLHRVCEYGSGALVTAGIKVVCEHVGCISWGGYS
jgi:hypothetical protein